MPGRFGQDGRWVERRTTALELEVCGGWMRERSLAWTGGPGVRRDGAKWRPERSVSTTWQSGGKKKTWAEFGWDEGVGEVVMWRVPRAFTADRRRGM